MSDNHPIAVIGAGIVGLSCALWLQKAGHVVTLIDPEPAGSGTSYGNACTIADYGCIPVNSPSLFKTLPSMLFSKDSPLSVNPLYALTHLPWCLKFLANCTPSAVNRIQTQLGGLLSKTYEGLTPLLDDTKGHHLLEQRGFLHVYKDDAEFDAAWPSNQARRDQGVKFTRIDAERIKELEPNLKIPFKHGLFFEDVNQVLNPQTLSTHYFDHFIANGGLYIKQKALAVQPYDKGVNVILDNHQKVVASKMVLAAGALSKEIAGSGAERLPLDTERGYHVQYQGLQGVVNRPVTWPSSGFYATPMDEGLRLVGTVEIAGNSKKQNQERLDYIKRKGNQMLDLPDEPEQTWLGFRPTMPDALPVIGVSTRSKNIYYAFGHHHLGLTLSGITGKIIS
ncbi:MAG: glycine/D-amino acid oxidase-like deaminating enzyme, partial [Gammaproteobacteria bacterium]